MIVEIERMKWNTYITKNPSDRNRFGGFFMLNNEMINDSNY